MIAVAMPRLHLLVNDPHGRRGLRLAHIVIRHRDRVAVLDEIGERRLSARFHQLLAGGAEPVPDTTVLLSTVKVASPVFSLTVSELPVTAETTPVAVIAFGLAAASPCGAALLAAAGAGTAEIARTVSACMSCSWYTTSTGLSGS